MSIVRSTRSICRTKKYRFSPFWVLLSTNVCSIAVIYIVNTVTECKVGEKTILDIHRNIDIYMASMPAIRQRLLVLLHMTFTDLYYKAQSKDITTDRFLSHDVKSLFCSCSPQPLARSLPKWRTEWLNTYILLANPYR